MEPQSRPPRRRPHFIWLVPRAASDASLLQQFVGGGRSQQRRVCDATVQSGVVAEIVLPRWPAIVPRISGSAHRFKVRVMDLRNELKHALKLPLRKPWYFLTAVVILALGTGINAVIFTLINATLLRPMSSNDPGRLVRVYEKSGSVTSNRFSYPDYISLRDQNLLDGMAATSLEGVAIRGDGNTLGEAVSSNYFSVIGITPHAGRFFYSSDETSPEYSAVISNRLWTDVYANDSRVVGREIILNSQSFKIVGIAPESFSGTYAGAGVDVWTLVSQVNWFGDRRVDRDHAMVQVLARLPQAVSVREAASRVSTAVTTLEKIYPRKSPRTGAEVVPATLLHGNLRKGISAFLGLMQAICALLLFGACANLANVTLMHAASRRRELAIRTALGGSRASIFRQFVMEGWVLSIAGGATGLLVSQWAADALLHLKPFSTIPIRFDFHPDGRIIAFQLLVTLGVGTVLGAIPAAWLPANSPASALKGESVGLTLDAPRSRIRSALLVLQVAVSLVLIVAAALFFQSLKNAAAMDPGFDTRHGLAADIDLKPSGMTQDQGIAFYSSLLRNVGALPGVESASYADLAPVDIATPGIAVTEPTSGKELRISTNTVDVAYFATLRIPLLRGRDFAISDRPGAMQVAIVNEALAQQFWPGGDAVGRQLGLAGGKAVSIIGIARNVKYRTLGETPEPHVYLPLAQNYASSMTLLVRCKAAPLSLLNAVQQEVGRTNPAVQAFFSRTLEQHLAFALLPARLASSLSAILGIITLALTAIGIYGSVGYSISLRTREIGIRMALGAAAGKVLKDELRRGLVLASAGLLIGLFAAAALGRLISGFLYQISSADLLTYAVSLWVLLVLCAIAILGPALRATRVNPATALRM